VLHQIGSGVLGPVFRTHDPRADRLLAVKVFRLDLPPDGVARLADALRRLAATPVAHPSLVPVVDAGVEGTSAFLVMGYESGDTLDIALRRFTPATLEQALPVLSRIAAGIDAAAEAGLVHGALHPRDVFLSAAIDEVTMTGFGIVQALEAAGVTTPVLRRPYVAPERANGRWDHRADVYSLGVIAHELLTGRRPVGLGEQDGVLASELQPHQRVLVRRVLSTALAERPDERYPSATALIAALEEITTHDFVALPGAAHGEDADRLAGATTDTEVSGDAPAYGRRATDAGSAAAEESEPVQAAEAIAADEAADAEPAAEPVPPAPADIGTPVAAASDGVDMSAPVPAPEVAHPLTLPLVMPASRAVSTLTPPGGIPPAWSAPRKGRVVPWVAVLVTAAVVTFGVLSGYRMRTTPPAPAATADVPAPLAANAPPSSTAAATGAVPPASSKSSPEARGAAPAPDSSAPAGMAAAAPGAAAPLGATAPASPDSAARSSGAASASARTADQSAASAPAGELVVRSDPPGALVTIDGRILGETPLVARGLSLGTHAVQVARPGHVPRAEHVVFRPSVLSQTLDLRLVPGLDQTAAPIAPVAPVATTGVAPAVMPTVSGPGAIDIDSRPRGAQVRIDGRLLGAAPMRALDLAVGEHLVTLELSGYATWTGRVMVVRGQPTPVHVALVGAAQ
jgi:serine/threonine-protein kinase